MTAAPRPRIGILGAGQLTRMLAQAGSGGGWINVSVYGGPY
jgi:phosphoribosylaminoimidazole carboxylase (NCAIR synthetase)